MNLQVSFDFDGVLSIPSIEEFAKELIEEGINVWVTTSRYNEGSNVDLLKVTERLGIPYSNIIFTSRQDKYKFLEKDFFIFHLDDEPSEINSIIENGEPTTPIWRNSTVNWKEMCREIIEFNLVMSWEGWFVLEDELDEETKEKLTEELNAAVEVEDYETAIKLRDKINELWS